MTPTLISAVNPSWVMALVALGTAAAGFAIWATRHIVRDEIEPVRQDLARQGEDVAVLRVAVFNHLSHDERPDETCIRKGLGYGGRQN